ncbi:MULTISPECIES: hypothetical protein [Gammaproteobacteria]|uniref:hypothetical protein n=1 Tax=Gammaproteobacteria TaxID=1236 RepID=UPI000DCFFE6B|nr:MULTISPECIES: hypothetical protein [Gammaproteobacteria]RTE86387.1 hypothetical protein DQX04_07440 [Aliidiomarina sp. B3213]TCZ91734.1 hypothetical protein EYQ95_07445 [Lysobacter sp. N42]
MRIPKFDQASSGRASQRTLLVWIVSGILVAIFASVFLYNLFKDDVDWKAAEFEMATKRFEEHLMLARVEWMRTGRPAEVGLLYADWDRHGRPVEPISGSVRVLMSKDGWPLARASRAEGCAELWYLLARTEPLEEELDIRYHYDGDRELDVCEFYFRDVLKFTFYPENGRVVKA